MNKYKVNKCFRFDEKTDNILKHLVEKENETSNKKISESEFMRELIQRCRHEHMGVPIIIRRKRKLPRRKIESHCCFHIFHVII